MPAIDAELSAIFTVIIALDAVVTVPANTVIFRRTMLGEWGAAAATSRSQLQIVSPLTPLVTSIVAPIEPETGQSAAHFAERYTSSRRTLHALRFIGLAELLLLVIGVPSAVATYSGIGFAIAIGTTLGTCSLGALVAFRFWRTLSGARPPLRKVLAWCWPFSAPRAAEDVLREVFRGASAAMVASLVLSRAKFTDWIRPLAYDHIAGDRNAAIDGLMTDAELAAIVRYVPKDRELGTASYCPRCGQSWAISAGHCNACHVALVAVDAGET